MLNLDLTLLLDSMAKPIEDKKPPADQESTSFIPKPEDIKFYPVYKDDRGLDLYRIIMTRHPPSWSEFFMSTEEEVKHACHRIEAETNTNGKAVYPESNKVLTAFWLTPLFTLRSIIVGQDPYPGLNKQGMPKAMGACFCSDRGNEIPDSLQTVYNELERSVEDWKHPGHPDIRSWGRQGVLLLNTALTVEAGRAKSHVGYWKPFTEKLIQYLNDKTRDVVFLLWGKEAQKSADGIYTSKHHKLNAYHPSPQNTNRAEYSFIGCDHFNQANIYLVSKGIRPIDWRLK